MALPSTETFTNTDGTELSTHNSAWTLSQGDLNINTNAIHANGGPASESNYFRNDETYDNDQYAEIELAAVANGPFIGVLVRASGFGAALNAYGAYADADTIYVFKINSGTWTQLGATITRTQTVGEVIRLEVEGTTLTLKIDGITNTTRTDSDHTSGAAGISGFSNVTTTRGDNWEGGNLSSGASVAPLAMHHINQMKG